MSKINSQYLKDSFNLLKGFWTSDQKWKALFIFALCIIFNFAFIYVNVKFSYWHRDFYNALQDLDQKLFIKLIYKFFILLIPFLAFVIAKVYFTAILSFLWRQWLTQEYLANWGKNDTYYHVLSDSNHIDNPDQRIANDLALVTESTLSMVILLIGEVANLISFAVILWGLSSTLAFSVFGISLAIPGYLVWAALLYAAIGTIITYFTGRKLVLFDFNQEKYEANFRRALIKLQEKREEIAFYKGIATEEKKLVEKFSMIKGNFLLIIKQKIYINIVLNIYNNLANIFPIIICSPMFFSKAIAFGVLMQISQAFGKVNDSFSIIISNFNDLASLKASLNRLIEFKHNITDAKLKYKNSQILVNQTDKKIIKIENLTLTKPNGEVILHDFSFDNKTNKKTLITGASGTGKTTIARALRGIWKYGKGDIEISKNTLFMSQIPFLPQGSLAESINYPKVGTGNKKLLTGLLSEFELPHLIEKLDTEDEWSNVLSMGEQQRLAIVRAIIHQPDVVIMDEPTSNLDKKTEIKAIELLLSKLKQSSFLVISHSEGIAKYFDKIINIEKLRT